MNNELESQIDDIILPPAEWQADDYYEAKGLLLDLIATQRHQAVAEFAEKLKAKVGAPNSPFLHQDELSEVIDALLEETK